MSQPSSRFSHEVRENFKEHLREAVAALQNLRKKLPLRENIAYLLHTTHHARSLLEITGTPVLQALRDEAVFQKLAQLSMNERPICEVLLGSDDPTDTDRIHGDDLFRNYIELMLVRIVALLHESGGQSLNDRLENFVTFLGLDLVERRVDLPLLNVDLCVDERDIPEFGRLKRTHQNTRAIQEPHLSSCALPLQRGIS